MDRERAVEFPVGLKVLVVDDDVTCLKIVEKMLSKCNYIVTSCLKPAVALYLLRERKSCFDLVLSDVHMPEMDGFKLLELVGLEMDLPVIMMSADGSTEAVMKGIRHGACDYLVKPIREEQLKNLWQHVVRKKWNGKKAYDRSCGMDDFKRPNRDTDDTGYSSFSSDGSEELPKTQRKRRDDNEEDCDMENDDPSAAKKPRVVWSVELHQKFVTAVENLGIDKAVPKRILEMMNVPGLTRENIASHLQKFRLYLKRLTEVGIPSPDCQPIKQNAHPDSLGVVDIQKLVASGRIPPEILAALQTQLLGQPTGTPLLTGIEQQLSGSLQGPKPILVDHNVSFGQPLFRCPSNSSMQFRQNIVAAEDANSGLGSWVTGGLSGVGPNNSVALVDQNGQIFMGMVPNHQQQQQQKQPTVSESSCSINVLPSCLVVPSQLPPSSHAVGGPASVYGNFSFDRNPAISFGVLSPRPSISSSGDGQLINRGSKTRAAVTGCSVPGSITSSMPSGSMKPDRWTASVPKPLPSVPSNIANIQNTIITSGVEQALDNGPLRSIGFVGIGPSISNRPAVDGPELHTNNINNVQAYMDNNGKIIQQERNMNFVRNERVAIPVSQNYSTNDPMSGNRPLWFVSGMP